MTEVGSDAGTITYQYNDQGRLISVTNVNGEKVSYTWDEYGNKTSMVYPDGREVRYTYDTMDRMTEVTGLDGEVTRYAYDTAGRRILTETAENTTTYEYDRIGSLVRQETTGVGAVTFTYSYNKNGYLTKEKRTEDGETTESNYTYDARGQLTGFRQNTGYGEKYTYDAAGNMLQKQITGTDGTRVQLTMQYNEGNQLTETMVGNERLTYSYDPNGGMTVKNLTGSYGTLTDTYTYNVLDQLTEYVGYDGYRQKYTYDANGMRLSKETYGNDNRSTLEEILRGNISGLPEVIQPETQEDSIVEDYEWATEEYLYDITQEYYAVIAKTETTATVSSTTSYAYGLERIAEYAQNQKTTYVYDGRGSVAKTVSTLKEGETREQNYIYTAFGEQMGTQKVSGFGYNAEAYDAATGMIDLRARQCEPAVGRFEQKDILMGYVRQPLSQNAYVYAMNSAIAFVDPSGMSNFFSKLGDSILGLVDAFKETAVNAYQGFVERAETALREPTFRNKANYALCGAVELVENLLKKNQENFNKMVEQPSVATVSNYVLMDQPASIKKEVEAALDPTNPKEQWKASFSLCVRALGTYHTLKNHLATVIDADDAVVTTEDLWEIGDDAEALVGKKTVTVKQQNQQATSGVQIQSDPNTTNQSVGTIDATFDYSNEYATKIDDNVKVVA